MLSKSLIQFSVDGWGWVPSLLLHLRPNYGGGKEDNSDLVKKVPCTAALGAPEPAVGHHRPMTNIDSIFKSRDITLPTKVHLVKSMVFLVVMYGCDSWTRKAERQRI